MTPITPVRETKTMNAAPVRVQLSRAKGWRIPANTVVVSRPSKWGNPHDWRTWLENAPREALPYAADRERWAKERATQAFQEDIADGTLKFDLKPLAGKNLACWCEPTSWCHASVLLELANRPENAA
jgi:hypothetical protein